MGFNKGIIVSSIIVSITFLCFSMFLMYIGIQNNVQVEPQYQNIFSNYNQTLQTYSQGQQIVDSGQINPSGQDQGVFKNVIIANKQIASSANLFIAFIASIPLIISVPTAIITMFITLVLIMSLFAFIRTITKVEA